MQKSICEHRDDGKAGGVFDSYEIDKVSNSNSKYQYYVTLPQIERVVNTKVWERYKYRRKEVADSNNNCANELMLFHGIITLIAH